MRKECGQKGGARMIHLTCSAAHYFNKPLASPVRSPFINAVSGQKRTFEILLVKHLLLYLDHNRLVDVLTPGSLWSFEGLSVRLLPKWRRVSAACRSPRPLSTTFVSHTFDVERLLALDDVCDPHARSGAYAAAVGSRVARVDANINISWPGRFIQNWSLRTCVCRVLRSPVHARIRLTNVPAKTPAAKTCAPMQ